MGDRALQEDVSDNMIDPRLEKAINGDRGALDALLFDNYDNLLRSIDRKLPADLQSVLTAEDVLQETLYEAYRDFKVFKPDGPNSFLKWLSTIARHRMLDMIKSQRRKKRGGGRHRVNAAGSSNTESILSLLDQIPGDVKTPSRVLAKHEAIAALEIGLAGLPEDYRQVLTLRYIEGSSVSETAKIMNRTDGAIQMLCQRALKQISESLGNASQYLSNT